MLDKSKTYLFDDATHCEAFIQHARACGQRIYGSSGIYTKDMLQWPWPRYMRYDTTDGRSGGSADAEQRLLGSYYVPPHVKRTVLPW